MVEIEIKRTKFRLRTEPTCMWIEELTEVKDRKTNKTKMEWRRVSGYYNDITLLANSFANDMILNSEATSMKKLTEELKKKKDSIAKMTIETIEKKGREHEH